MMTDVMTDVMKSGTGRSANLDNGMPVSYTHLDVYKRQASQYACRPAADNRVVVIRSSYMGEGSEELGKVLIKLSLIHI